MQFYIDLISNTHTSNLIIIYILANLVLKLNQGWQNYRSSESRALRKFHIHLLELLSKSSSLARVARINLLYY